MTAAVARPPRAGKVRLRTTGAMRMLALVVGLMVVAAINYQSNAAWAMVMLLVGMVGLSGLHARRALASVGIAAVACDDTFAQDQAHVRLIAHTDAIAGVADLAVAIPAWQTPTVQIGELRAGRSLEVSVPVPPLGRGIHHATSIRLSTRFPLGLIEASRELPVELRLVIYPQPLGRAGGQLPDPTLKGAGLQAQPLPGADDFHGHRRYQEGDAQRQIDWKAHARGQPLLVKRFTSSAGAARWCSWDETHGDQEARLSQLALWLLEAHAQGAAIGLRLRHERISPGQGAAHLRACLQALAAHPHEVPAAPALAP